MKNKYYAVKIALICVVVWLIQYVAPITDEFSLVSSEVLSRPWTLITYMFLHGSFQHLFYNMIALIMFGSVLESIIGSRKFLSVYIISGLFAALGSILFYDASIGASGAIYGLIGTLVVIRPMLPVFAFYIVPMPLAVVVAIWSLGDFFGVFFPTENTAYAAHIFGLLFGVAYGLYIRRRYAQHKQKRKDFISEREFREWENRWM